MPFIPDYERYQDSPGYLFWWCKGIHWFTWHGLEAGMRGTRPVGDREDTGGVIHAQGYGGSEARQQVAVDRLSHLAVGCGTGEIVQWEGT